MQCKTLNLVLINAPLTKHRGNKVEAGNRKKKLTSSEARKKKKERMARRKRGEEVFSDEDD